MIAELPAKPTTHTIDAIGGVRCNGCHKPLVKVTFDVAAPPKIVMFIRCHNSLGRGLGECGHYNVVNFEAVVLS